MIGSLRGRPRSASLKIASHLGCLTVPLLLRATSLVVPNFTFRWSRRARQLQAWVRQHPTRSGHASADCASRKAAARSRLRWRFHPL